MHRLQKRTKTKVENEEKIKTRNSGCYMIFLEKIIQFFKKKKQHQALIFFNKEVLYNDLATISDQIRAFKNDDCLKWINEAIRISKNLAIIEASYARNDEDRIVRQAKIVTFQELQNFIDNALTKIPAKEETVTTTRPLNAYRRTTNQAESSV